MRRCFAAVLIGVLILAIGSTDVLARSRRNHPADNYVSFSFFIQPLSVGYKHRMVGNLYITGNMDYDSSESDLFLQAGTAYMLPRKILFFRLYGGGGLELSRNRGVMYPYVMVGTKFWFLYAEIIHPLERERDPGYRFGFSFSF